ncbi:YveK family protein [Desulforamulus aeronauticus]|uniref:Capsular polysaccharide biosynthesis protein n=1 Tax=Desulforamulus aeronauticus DSM 10349 TaxID=1121421 RepID=A0A1M6V3U2_9FIRM|nr:Wzz/FepE/Etk N-terminal domain-containing protein [Desulforamulus aeronauticus]SHK76108.1 Capsular polysaccharide biosynthesis protein [Desulforamulus aeronauticus DSM 10349]
MNDDRMEVRDDFEVIDLRDIWRILKKGKWLLISLPLIAMIVSGIISFFVLTPRYEASTTLMVGKTYEGQNAMMVQYNDILTANQLVKTYSQLAKSRSVVEKVIEFEKLNVTHEQLSKNIDVKPVKDTQLIQITVEDTNPERAAMLANTTAAVFMGKVVEIMKVGNVNIIDNAVAPESPVKPNKKLNIVVAGVIGLMIALGLVFLLEFLDRTIKNGDDVQRHLGLPVLGVIPKMDKRG